MFVSLVRTVEGKLVSLASGSLMTSQIKSKVHECSMECFITSSKAHFINNQRYISYLAHMLLIEVTDTRSGHRGQVTKGQHMNPILLWPCDACFMWPIFHFLLNGVGQTTIRGGLDYVLVEVRPRSGQKGTISKLIFLHKEGTYSMQLITGNQMGSQLYHAW